MPAARSHRPWILRQEWRELLFAHWACDPAAIAPLIPAGLRLDLRDGAAWIGVVPFRMTGVRLRGLPPVPTTSTFLELNVRTYVERDDVPGVWFFSLDAASRLAVMGARAAYHLPYHFSEMERTLNGDTCTFSSARPAMPRAAFQGVYGPTGPEFVAAPGSLDAFLVERYCLYAIDRRGRIHRADIEHPPWRLHAAHAEIDARDLCGASGIELPSTPPRLHYATHQVVKTWAPVRVSTTRAAPRRD